MLDASKIDLQKAFESGDAKEIINAIASSVTPEDVLSAFYSVRQIIQEELGEAAPPGGILHRK